VSAPDAGRPVTEADVAPPARSRPDASAAAPLRAPAASARRLAEERLTDPMVPRAELAEWRERFGLVAGLTLRGGNGGFSLGLLTEEPIGQVMGRWRAFLHAMGPGFPALQMARQAHSASVAWHEGVAPGWHVADELDGHATAQPGLLLAVTIADCVPVYLAAPGGRAFALLHAGWRGIAAGVLERGVGLLASRAGVGAGELAVHLGVGICGRCYEVGPEVVRAIEGRSSGGASQLDLRDALAQRAARLGINDLTRSPHCTACSRQSFFSHRGSAGRDGRMVAYLGRPLDEVRAGV
jgi:YfiH family protein